MRRLTVGVLPLDVKNPYQSMLGRELERLGATVKRVRGAWLFSIRSPWIWRAEALHLHWLNQVVLGPNVAASTIRSVVTLVQLVVLRALGMQLVWTVHNIQNHERYQVRLERAVARLVGRLASAIVVHCHQAKREVLKQLAPGAANKISVIPHGNFVGHYPNDIGRGESRRRLGIDSGDVVFLLFGSLRDYKCVPDLITTFRSLAAPRARLIIAGAAQSQEGGASLRRMADRDHRVGLYTGFVPDEKVQVFMNASDVVVIPYRAILMSSVAMLALSFGRPVVAPRKGCLPEVLDGSCAFLYGGGVQGLRGALEAVLDAGGERLREMGLAAKSRAGRTSGQEAAALTIRLYRPGPPVATGP